jgi:FkbM family methyltransferase
MNTSKLFFKKGIHFLIKKVRGSKRKFKRFVPSEKQFLGNTLYIHDMASYQLGLEELFVGEIYNFTTNNPRPYIIDCGANLGMSIIYFKKLYPQATIIAFEADDYIFSFLEKNMQSYKLKNVDVINKAVWKEECVKDFWVEGGAGGRLESKKNGGKYNAVTCTRLKPYLQIRKVDFLKMDIEGAEYEVLKDCENELYNVENIFIEYHSFSTQPQNLDKILNIIKNAGFRYHIKEAFVRNKPFIERNVNADIDLQLNIFCYRE